jgi:cytochrome c-type biogenesis protein
MFEGIFTTLYDALSTTGLIAILAAFGWGALSIILSPCHLSSIPLIIGFINSQGKVSIRRTFSISLIFSLGILITIALIGIITASLGRLMGDIGVIGNYLVAGIFLIVGLYLLDIIKINWGGFGFYKTNTKGMAAALILGLLFGLALGPCTFAYMAPVLGVVFQTSQTDYSYSILLLSAFGIGHCAVIVGAGTMMNKIQIYLNWTESNKMLTLIKKICGVLVIAGGIYLIIIT